MPAAAEVDADVPADLLLKEQRFDLRGRLKPDVADGGKSPQLRRQLEVGGAVEDEDAGVDEVRLPLVLVRAKVGSRLTGDLRPVPVCARRRPWRFQRLNGPPANAGMSRIASKPRPLPSARSPSPDAMKAAPLMRSQSLSIDSSSGAHLRVDVDSAARRSDCSSRARAPGRTRGSRSSGRGGRCRPSRGSRTARRCGADDADRRRPDEKAVRVVVQARPRRCWSER